MTTAIHVRFVRTCDAEGAFETVREHVSVARLEEAGIEVECDPVAEAAVRHELELALDEWLHEHALPFLAEDVGDHTVMVHPTAG